MSVRTYTVDVN